MQKLKLLLIDDVEDLGKSGEVVSVKPGYARNFLLPKSLAMIADKNTLRRQEKLQKERAIKAAEFKKESENLAKRLAEMTLSITVKVDPEGKMYGSVTSTDIIELFKKENIEMPKKCINLKKPIKQTGVIEVPLKLKEDVDAVIKIEVIPEKIVGQKEEKSKKKKETEDQKTEE